MNKYNPQEIEIKWQKIWDEKSLGQVEDFSKKPKYYNLVEFPYPSGSGLHVGHCMGYTASDVHSRMKRMQGYNVLFPIGWDAFGLPTENYAIKTGKKPADVTRENTDFFRKQMKSLAYSFDWDREINTTDPNYYKWTQWIFLQFYKHAYIDGKLIEVADDDHQTPRLAYQAEMPINWCPSCKIGLANEEVIDGKCERCGTQTFKKMQKQWMLRITAYADRLIDDLSNIDYLDKIKTQQTKWIGRSCGTNIKFAIKDIRLNKTIDVFTTRADTLFGCTYVVLSPEHPLIADLKKNIKNLREVEKYIQNASKKTDLERTELQKEKTGVKLEGIAVINPINGEEVEVWIADYVLASYGTGAIMAVPAHDQRDFEFAKKFGIKIKQVIAPFFTTTEGADAVRKDKKTARRKMIVAIVKHWKEDKIFCLNWEKFDWRSFILGGIEADETQEEAAIREVKEESGYQNIKSVNKIGMETHSNFFARHKDVNRYSMSDCYVIELADGSYVKPEEEHVKNHDGTWIDRSKVSQYVNLDNNIYYADIFLHGEKAFTEYGVMVNSGEFSGLSSDEGKNKVTEQLKNMNAGDFAVNYKLRDWVFSRQHYWGEPIPIIYCEKCGKLSMNEKDLPLVLPEVEKYEPTDTGESPLAMINEWVNIECPKCGSKARRETDTMPNWAGSSWYFLRYCDPQNENRFADAKKLDYWMPVDLYNGGMEHTNLHLLYSRFWHKFLYDLGKVPTPEPYQKRIAHGIILGADNQKMSKSKGNVVIPDEIVQKYGADTMRTYIMFIGPYDQESAWNVAGLQGVYRFLHRVWSNFAKVKPEIQDEEEFLAKLNKYINSIRDDVENFRLNTYVAKLMEINNEIDKLRQISKESFETYLKLLSPAAPHFCEELWNQLGNISSIFSQSWPISDEKYLIGKFSYVAVQVDGKLRGVVKIKSDTLESEVMQSIKDDLNIWKWLDGKTVVRVVYKPGKIISIVLK